MSRYILLAYLVGSSNALTIFTEEIRNSPSLNEGIPRVASLMSQNSLRNPWVVLHFVQTALASVELIQTIKVSSRLIRSILRGLFSGK
jgi:hypothetical protein